VPARGGLVLQPPALLLGQRARHGDGIVFGAVPAMSCDRTPGGSHRPQYTCHGEGEN